MEKEVVESERQGESPSVEVNHCRPSGEFAGRGRARRLGRIRSSPDLDWELVERGGARRREESITDVRYVGIL